jgi:hypothetical protein
MVLIAAVLAVVAVQADAAVFRLGGQVKGGLSSLIGDLPEEGSWQRQFGLGAGIVAEMNFTSAV